MLVFVGVDVSLVFFVCGVGGGGGDSDCRGGCGYCIPGITVDVA